MQRNIVDLPQPLGPMADFGTLPADVAGHKIFDLAAPRTLTKGWYVTTMGVSGAGAYARYGRWMTTPGLTRYYPYSSGTRACPCFFSL